MLPLEIGSGHQLRQVSIALQVLAEQDHRVWLVDVICIDDTHINADQGLYAPGKRFFIELDQREEIALIGQCDRWHVPGGALLHERRNTHRTIDDRKFGMDVQMDERLAHGIY